MHTYTRTGTVTHVDTYPHMKSRPPAETHAECIAPQAIPAILAPPPCRPSLLADAATTNAREAICVGDCRARRSCRPSCPLPPAPQQNRAPSVAVTHRVCCDAMDQRRMSATTSPKQALLIDHKARRSPTDTNKGGLTAWPAATAAMGSPLNDSTAEGTSLSRSPLCPDPAEHQRDDHVSK